MRKFRRYRLMHSAPDDNGGNAPGGQAQDRPGDTAGDNSNNETNLNPFADPAITEPNAAQQGTAQPPTQEQPNTGTFDLKSYVKNLNLLNGIDMRQLQADLTGDDENGPTFDSLQDALETVAVNTFQQSLMHANQLMDKRINQAVDKAVKEATGTVNAQSAIRQLNSELPFTRDPSVAPVAKAALTGFLKQGQDTDTAIANTIKFFEATANKLGSHFGGSTAGRPNTGFSNRPGQQSQQTAGQQQQPQDTDWMALLGPNDAAET